MFRVCFLSPACNPKLLLFPSLALSSPPLLFRSLGGGGAKKPQTSRAANSWVGGGYVEDIKWYDCVIRSQRAVRSSGTTVPRQWHFDSAQACGHFHRIFPKALTETEPGAGRLAGPTTEPELRGEAPLPTFPGPEFPVKVAACLFSSLALSSPPLLFRSLGGGGFKKPQTSRAANSWVGGGYVEDIKWYDCVIRSQKAVRASGTTVPRQWHFDSAIGRTHTRD